MTQCVLCLPVVTAVAVSAAVSCSAVVDTSERQCASHADCDRIGLEGLYCIQQVCQTSQGSTAWSCLGDVHHPVSSERKVSLSIPLVDVITTRPPQGLQARFCPKLDVECDIALPGRYYLQPDGALVIDVEAGFDGYVELSAPDTTPALFFVTEPVWHDTVIRSVLPLVSPEGFAGIAQNLGTELDLEQCGHVYALASDCDGVPAEGVRFELEGMTPDVTPYYMINNVPVASAEQTDASGSGGFLNIPAGFTRVTGFVASSDAEIGEAGFIVRPGAVSYPLVLP